MIPIEKDAFGKLMMAFHLGQEVVEIIEREDGFISAGRMGPPTYFSPFETWAPRLQQAMSYVQGRVLDLGCGAGRVPLYLQSQGLEVVGIDNSPLAIEICKQRGVHDARQLSITQVDSRLGVFDTITMLGHNFGLFGSLQRARWLLRRWHKITSPHARIIAESNDPAGTTNPVHLAYHAYNLQRGRMRGQLNLRVRYENIKGPWFDYLIVSPAEMQDILVGTGWGLREILTDPETTSYVALLEKENSLRHKTGANHA